MPEAGKVERNIGLWGATSIGVGAIVGGGILALAGIAFASAGPSAILAFALNGVIAILTALCFAELAAAFPESGGTYVFARKVLSVKSAFAVGWVVWFASIVAAVLYAMGFASFACTVIAQLLHVTTGSAPAWILSRWMVVVLAALATIAYSVTLVRSAGGGDRLVNIGKLVVFGILIAAGLYAFARSQGGTLEASFVPFFPGGLSGLVQAMGFTFIALQGFDLIAAAAGEIRDPGKTIPRAMLLSLGIALLVYVPLLFVLIAVGFPSSAALMEVSRTQPEAIVALGARHYLGSFGYWLVLVAGVLSMLSALQANIMAAARVAAAMSRDRTLPVQLSRRHPSRGTPVAALFLVAGLVVIILVILPNVASAGAASSLIFLLSFALVHGIGLLAARRRAPQPGSFRAPGAPLVSIVGGLACLSLAVFQGFSVPSAGAIALAWLILGLGLYMGLFAQRAQVVDAASQAGDAELVKMRGYNPWVMVPIANPANAPNLVSLGYLVAPPENSRILLFSVVAPPAHWVPGEEPAALNNAQAVLRESLVWSFANAYAPEALITIAQDRWAEIARMAGVIRCESLLLGLSNLDQAQVTQQLESLISEVDCEVVVLRAPNSDWSFAEVKRILIPLAGRGGHRVVRARVLGGLYRTHGERLEATYATCLPAAASNRDVAVAESFLGKVAADEFPGTACFEVDRCDDPAQSIIRRAQFCDLLFLGVQRRTKRHKTFGELVVRIAKETSCGIIVTSRRG